MVADIQLYAVAVPITLDALRQTMLELMPQGCFMLPGAIPIITNEKMVAVPGEASGPRVQMCIVFARAIQQQVPVGETVV